MNKEIITSRSNPLIKWASSLLDKKGRQAESTFIAEGIKLVVEAIEAGLPISHIFLNASKQDILMPIICEALKKQGIDNNCIHLVADSVFGKISSEKAPQGAIAAIKYLDFSFNIDIIYKEAFFIEPNDRIIALCSVRDPSNLGAVIRSSVAFGVNHIVLTDDCADLYNPKTVRSAMGSLFRVKTSRVKNFGEFIDAARYNGRRVYAAELSQHARALGEIDLHSSDIFVIGNEGHGIPDTISGLCDGSVYIPISKNTESLNASVAAAIFMWEQSKK